MLYILYTLYSIKRVINLFLFGCPFLTGKEGAVYFSLRWRIIGPKRFAQMLTLPILRTSFPMCIMSEIVSVEPLNEEALGQALFDSTVRNIQAPSWLRGAG